MNEMVAAVAARRPRTLVPLLTGVFVIAWGLLILLVIMQDRMIDAQSELIHTFFNQSVPRGKANPALVARPARQGTAKAGMARGSVNRSQLAQNAQGFSEQKPVPQSSVSPVPLSEKSLSQSPSSQVKAKPTMKAGRNAVRRRSPFSPPPAEITDPSDKRRVSITI